MKTTIESSLLAAIAELAAICIYNSVTRPGEPDSFLHPEPLDDRKKITTVIQKFSPSRKTVLSSRSKPRSDSVVPILEKCLNISKTDAKKMLENEKSSGKFHLYIVPLDEGSRAMLFAYKKDKKHYVLSIAQKGTAGTSAWINMERAGRADPEERLTLQDLVVQLVASLMGLTLNVGQGPGRRPVGLRMRIVRFQPLVFAGIFMAMVVTTHFAVRTT